MRNVRNKILLLIFHSSLLISHLPADVASCTHGADVYYYSTLYEALTASHEESGISPDDPHEITILGDIVLDEPVIIGGNQHITLIPAKGNSSPSGSITITRGSGLIEFPLLWVQGENASLTLGKPDMEYELIFDGAYLSTPSITAHAPIVSVTGPDAKLIMHDKVILHNNYNNSTIPPDKLYQHGAGVLVRSVKEVPGQEPEFIMRGGVIQGNTNNVQNPVPHGGGVMVTEQGIFTMEGGAIMNNTAYGIGGGVYIEGRGFFTKTGGVIYGSDAPSGYRDTAIEGHYKVYGHAIYIAVSNNILQRYRDDTIGENETLTYTGSHDGHGVFGKGEKWHNENTVLQRNLLVAGIVLIALGVPLALAARKKLKAKEESEIEAALAAAAVKTSIEPGVELSAREKEVFDLLLTELSVKEIGYNLQLTYPGVNYHIRNLYAKVGVKTRMELVVKYRKK